MPDIGAKKEKCMKKIRVGDTVTGTFGKMTRVKDFLPPPKELVFKNPTVKVTITLQQESIDFFKREAKRLNTSYQRMIRNLLQEYTQKMTESVE